jgi:TolA-binding protein
MERSSAPPPDAPRPAADVPEDDLPASRGDLRSLRRWVAVAGVWALAATAIAVIALISGDDSGDDQAAGDVARQVSRIQRQLDSRLDSLESRVDRLPQTEDVQKLEDRLREAETSTSRAAEDAKSTNDQLSDLEGRVEELEQSGAGTEMQGDGASP